VKPDPLSFFTIDHGTASTAAALIAPVGGRFRLLAASAAPRGISVEAILEDLVARVGATEPGMLPDPEEWPSWARLEVATYRPLRVVCAAGSERRADDVARAFLIAGWDVVARFGGTGTDPRAVTEACLDRSVTAVALAAGEPPSASERPGLAALAPMIAAAAQRRPDLRVILFGGATSWSGGFPAERVVHAPAPGPELRGSAAGAPHFARQVAAGWASDAGARQLPDGREGFIVGAASLASLLDRSVDAIDIGCAAGLRAVVRPDGAVEWLLRADAALVPSRAMTDDVEVDRILRWCALRSEQSALRDRVRNLGLAPWRDAAGDGARIRSAALRAALTRLAAGWTGGDVDAVLHGRETAVRRAVLPGIASGFTRPASRDAGIASLPDLVVAAGGAFAAVPAPIAALALLDVLRRPGARTLLWDHARLLGPIGTLQEADRRRILADLLDDAFVPLGSTLVAGGLRPGRSATLRVTSPVGSSETSMVAGSLRSVDLPPGVTAHVEIEAREPIMLGVRARHVAMELSGGLTGLLLDARETPLRLHERADLRRAQLDGWERPFWPGLEP